MHRLLWPAAAAAIGIAVLVSLGVWQLQRLAWKQALIARVEVGLEAAPVPAPGPQDWAALDLVTSQYRRVVATGRFLADQEVFVNATLTAPKGPLGGYGFFVMTPLETEGGWIVYVNRGFVPRDRKSSAARRERMTAGDVTVVGLLRRPRRRAWFMPRDNRIENEWFSRDPILFAEAQGRATATVAPYLIDAPFDPALPGGLPQGGETIVTFPNNHLQYALSWFGLALALAAVFVGFAWSQLRR